MCVCEVCVYLCVHKMCRVCMYRVYMCLCECVLTYRGQFEGVGFLLPPWGSQELTRVPRLGSKHLYQLSHLTALTLVISNEFGFAALVCYFLYIILCY